MSLHIYFTGIETNERFKKTKVGGKDSYDKFHFCGMQVFQKGAEWYTLDLDLEHEMPEAASSFVSSFSYHECFPLSPKRETGVYFQEGTEAELSVNSSNYFVQLRGAGRAQIKKLLRAIRAGTIRPTESWEGSQNGLSRQQLESKLALWEDRCRTLEIELNAVREELLAANRQIGGSNPKVPVVEIQK